MQGPTTELTIEAVDRILCSVQKKGSGRCPDREQLLSDLEYIRSRYIEYCARSRLPRVADLLKSLARIDTKLSSAEAALGLPQAIEQGLIQLLDKEAEVCGLAPGKPVSPEDRRDSSSTSPTGGLWEVIPHDVSSPASLVLERWRQATAELRKLITQLQASEQTSASRRGAKFFEDIIWNDIPGLNYFDDKRGPETALIAFDIYALFQQSFDAAITWQNDLDASPSGGASVRFAEAVLRELGITQPRRKQPYTPAEIIAIWRQHAGRSHKG